MFQNQPFIDPLRNRCYWIIDKLHREKPVLESLFNKAAVPRTRNFIKEDSDTGASLWNLQTFRIYKFSKQLFWRNLWMSASKLYLKKDSNTGVFPWILWFKNTYFVEDLQTAGSETPVRGSLFNKVASLTAWTHLTVLEAEAATGGVL